MTTPEGNIGDVIGDLNRRRGQIIGQENHKGSVIVHAEVPLSEMFGYSTQLVRCPQVARLIRWSRATLSACPPKSKKKL